MSEQLQIKNLVKRYQDDTVLDGLNFSVMQGEVVVIVGPSGCGKSTLLRCINGLEPIHSGEIRLDGTPLIWNEKKRDKMHQKIGMVFQSYDLFPHMSVLNNITLAPVKVQKRPKKEVEKEAVEWLGRVGLSEKRNVFPRQLSGGQKQRAAIVRSLCMHPEIMLFDEVTAALDPEMVHEVLDVILELASQGITMLIVTHEMQFARTIADRILFMEHGQIIEDTSPEVFFTSPKTQRAKDFLKTFSYEKRKTKTLTVMK
ncbi:amino acid ABC transporter ATP-binding protein [Sinanaerobacter sp. ZZT-01]|nr:amino acid ABC transporter ATP-binding protein [Sinanaerobacter sp. ZZT-01]WRR94634.1 amino acid ABC transporter ATP-binding protein [Sinanaerobacter sp. ZZT-01]